jgi:hypothetical protein
MEITMLEVGLDIVRQKAIALLDGKASGVRVRSLVEFNHFDDAVFYADRQDKAFNLCIVSDVAWESPVSSYTEEPDDMRSKSILMVDVANHLDGNEHEVVELYQRWFNDTEGVG